MKKYQTEEERKEVRKQYLKQWYQDNREKMAEHYQANKEKILEQHKQWYEANKEKRADYMRQYRKTPMGRANKLVNRYKRNDKKYNRGECILTTKWIIDNIFSQKCIYCGEDDWRKLGCDRIDNSKPHTEDNVVPCCASCNSKRGTKPFETFIAECNAEERLREWEEFLTHSSGNTPTFDYLFSGG